MCYEADILLMSRRLSWLAPLCIVLLAASCSDDGKDTQTVPPDALPIGFCDLTIPCTDATLPFCDVGGIYPGSEGKPNTCIAKPLEVDCAEPSDCTDESLPQCTTAGECVECLNFSHCNTDNPICSFTTHTCGSCRVGDEGNAVCEAIDPFQPLCAKTGACVECLDNTPCGIISAPICDLTTYSCRGCLNTEECAVGTCNTVSGVCEAS